MMRLGGRTDVIVQYEGICKHDNIQVIFVKDFGLNKQ